MEAVLWMAQSAYLCHQESSESTTWGNTAWCIFQIVPVWFDGDEITGSLSSNYYTFTGRRSDPEAELMYFRNRYYSPKLGRFVGRDPLRRQFIPERTSGTVNAVRAGNPYENGMSLYAASFAPNKTDPLGLRSVLVLIKYNDTSGIITPSVESNVSSIFNSCFSTLKCDSVSVLMVPAKAPGYLGRDRYRKPRSVQTYLRTTLTLPAKLGSAGRWQANINGAALSMRARGIRGSDMNAAVANVIAHEIGLHVIANKKGHPYSTGAAVEVDRTPISRLQYITTGIFSVDCCKRMKRQLAVQ